MTPFYYRQSYRRKLPHIQTPGSTIFTTFRLFGSVPATILDQYRTERMYKAKQAAERSDSEVDAEFYRKWFLKIDAILDNGKHGPTWLGRPDLRSIVFEKMLEGDVTHYRVDAFSIMNNHVHSIFRPNVHDGKIPHASTLAKIMQSWKGSSARECNRLLRRKGQFWDHESFDREIRGAGGFDRAVRYTLRNPVKARLVSRPADWPGNYISDRLLQKEWVRELWESASHLRRQTKVCRPTSSFDKLKFVVRAWWKVERNSGSFYVPDRTERNAGDAYNIGFCPNKGETVL